MAEKIYIRNASGGLEPVVEERFETEDLLQELIGQHPELLAGDQMRPEDPLRWILIRREMSIEGWAVDHLLIDQDARPTLVEVKRSSNREIRRNIVGQMLDYAATAAVVWSEHDMRRIFEENSDDPDDEIGTLIGADDDLNIGVFWEQVATNLDANRMRLLFVADEIPPELERVVKFLNEQTRDNLEVLAVEIKQYPGQFGDALVSRVIGQKATSDISKAKTGRILHCLCGCGNENKPASRFNPGHDAKLNATLNRVDEGTFLHDDVDLNHIATICKANLGLYLPPSRFYNRYCRDEIMRLAQKQAVHRQQS